MDPLREQNEGQAAGKQRHGCLAVLLGMLLVYGSLCLLLGSLIVLIYFVFPGWAQQFRPLMYTVLIGLNRYYIFIYFVTYLLYLLSAVALFKWKKWGFWVYVAAALAPGIIYLITGAEYIFTLLLLFNAAIFIAILYGVLHIGEGNKGWPQLE